MSSSRRRRVRIHRNSDARSEAAQWGHGRPTLKAFGWRALEGLLPKSAGARVCDQLCPAKRLLWPCKRDLSVT